MNETSDWSDIEVQLQQTRELLTEVEARFLQIRRDSAHKLELEAAHEKLRSQIEHQSGKPSPTKRRKSRHATSKKLRRSPDPHKEELLKQLQALDEQIEQIEAELESRLLSWSSFREPFWQMVRFGGLGIVIGILLRSCAS